AARTVSTKQFQGMLFMAKIGIEKGGPNKKDGGFWPDKNCLAGVITKDKKEWHPVEQPPPFDGGSAPSRSSGASGGPPVQRRARGPARRRGVMKKVPRGGRPSLTALKDQWQREPPAAAIAAARGVVQMDGPIPPGTPIGRLSDTECGWIVAGVLFAWISKRAE